MARVLPFAAPEIAAEPAPPRVPQSDYQRIQTSPDMFGAAVGRAEERAGAQTSELGRLYGQVAGSQAANEYLDYQDKLLHGDPNDPNNPGLLNLRGQDAMRAYPLVQQQLKAKRDELTAGLGMIESQEQFNNRTMLLERYALNAASTHARQQQVEWAGEQAKSQADLSLRQTANAALTGDVASLDALRDSLRHAEVGQLQAKAGFNISPEMRADAVARADAGWVTAQVRALAHVNPQRASAVLDANRVLLGPQYDTLKREIDSTVRGANVAGAVNEALGGANAAGSVPSGDLWSRVKGQERGLGPSGKALVSPKGAIGVSQILPGTARDMAGDLGLPYDEWRLHTDQAYNERLGQAYLGKMLDRYGGNEMLAAAAYNAGPDRVDSWLHTIGDPRRGEVTDAEFARHIPFKETREYVDNIIAGTAREGLRPSAPPSGRFDLAAGDSIAVQQIRHGIGGVEEPYHHEGEAPQGATARIGDTPEKVNARIAAMPPEAVQGKTIFLSPGTSNDPSQVDLVGSQIAALKGNGAGPIVVPGVGPGVKDSADVNAKLKQVVEQNGGIFFQPHINWQPDGIHPAEVDKVRAQGLAALAASRGKSEDQIVGGGAPTGGPPASAQAGLGQLPITGPVPRAPLIPPGTPNDMLGALDRIEQMQRAGRLSPQEAELAQSQVERHFRIRDMAETREERLTEHNLKLYQTSTEARLFSDTLSGKAPSDADLAPLVGHQAISVQAYNAIREERDRHDEGRDDDKTSLDLWKRIEGGENASDLIMAARQQDHLSRKTAVEMVKANETRQREGQNQVERTAFAELRTIAGGDAVEKGMLDFGDAAKQAQIGLWAQAQGEWNRRVVVGKEDPRAVLADMTPHYVHDVTDVRGLPHPRTGEVHSLDDLKSSASQIEAMHAAGQLDERQYENEKQIIVRLKGFFDDQQKRQDAAARALKGAPKASGPGGQVRGVNPAEQQ